MFDLKVSPWPTFAPTRSALPPRLIAAFYDSRGHLICLFAKTIAKVLKVMLVSCLVTIVPFQLYLLWFLEKKESLLSSASLPVLAAGVLGCFDSVGFDF